MPAVAHIIRRRRSRKRRRNKETRLSTFWSALVIGIPLALALTPLLGALGLSLWLYASAASTMPTPQETVWLGRERGATRFYDASGDHLIYSVAGSAAENRHWLTLEDLPPDLINATVVAEGGDLSPGADAFAPAHTLLQLWRYILGASLEAEGGISGNLTRDTILPGAMTGGLDARLLEIALAAESRRKHSPEGLLEWRLNSGYYGRDAFGIEAAAQVYLGKPAASLSAAESALLAAIVDEPALNPFDAPLKSRERGADLLFRMLDAELIDQAQFDEATSIIVTLGPAEGRQAEIAPAFIEYARRQAEGILDGRGYDGARMMARGALRITTTLDMALQLQAECVIRVLFRQPQLELAHDGSACAVAEQLHSAETARSALPEVGSLALIDVSSGKILSLAGDALTASRQPAIVLQPFVYIDAFLRREFTPASMVYDLPQSFPGRSAELIYAPANPDGLYRGPLNLRDAMAGGLLPPAVQVASRHGMESTLRTARALGFNNLDLREPDLDLLERGGAVSVIDAAYAYSVLAATGAMRGLPVAPLGAGYRSRDPLAILKIEDGDGRLLWSHDGGSPADETVIIEPSAAYMVNDILADVQARERVRTVPANNLRLSRRAAVVDGSSADRRDHWTVGYSPDLVLAVHTARADGEPLGVAADERVGSAEIWRSLMEYAHAQRQLPARDWDSPADLEEFLVCEISGLLPATTSHCPTRREIVPSGAQLLQDHYWRTVEINRANGQLATVNTPDALREAATYFMPPDEAMNWWVENGKPLPPSSYSTEGSAQFAKPVRFLSPADYAYVGATVEIAAIVSRAGAQSWQLEYGAEVNPERWFKIGERRTLDAGGEIATTWETALFSGIYTLRLSVTFADGSVETDTRLLTFDNTPPAVKLITSERAENNRFPSQRVVSLRADVSDNLTIDRVEFFHDGEKMGEDRVWPYGYEYELEGAGEYVFSAIVYDQVGNRAASELALLIEA